MSWKTPTENVYGIGENEQSSFKHNFDGTTWALYGRDQPPSVSWDEMIVFGPFFKFFFCCF